MVSGMASQSALSARLAKNICPIHAYRWGKISELKNFFNSDDRHADSMNKAVLARPLLQYCSASSLHKFCFWTHKGQLNGVQKNLIVGVSLLMTLDVRYDMAMAQTDLSSWWMFFCASELWCSTAMFIISILISFWMRICSWAYCWSPICMQTCTIQNVL